MNLPDHVKRQAMAAVSHKETTAMIRAYKDSGIEASPEKMFSYVPPVEPGGPIPEKVKRLAKAAVINQETLDVMEGIINLGQLPAPYTPRRETERISHTIARMHRSGQNLHSIHRSITQDKFGIDHD